MQSPAAIQFGHTFPLTSDIVCHNHKTANAIILDIEGFITQHKLDIKVTKHKTFTVITGRGVINSDCVLMINDHVITQINTYYSENEIVEKNVTWKNLRRSLIAMINNS